MKANRHGADHTGVWCPDHQSLYPLLYVPPGLPCPWPACEYGTSDHIPLTVNGEWYVRSTGSYPPHWVRLVNVEVVDSSKEGT